jgi:hypothetical protein
VQAAIELIKNVRKVPEKNLALRNVGDLQFAKSGADWGLDVEGIEHGAALCDFDGDGDLDVLTLGWNEPAALFENKTADGKSIVVRLRGQSSDRFGIGARLVATLADGTRILRENWLARGYLSGQAPEVHFGLGNSDAVAQLEVRWPSGHGQTFANLVAGRLYTVTEPPGRASRIPAVASTAVPATFSPAAAPPFMHRENEFDEYVAQPLLPAGVSRLGPGMALGDVDGDGDDDLFVGGAMGQAGTLWLADGDHWREQPGPWQQDAACEDMGCLWLDYDSDGDLDLFVASGGAERKAGDPALRDRLYRNDGGGKFGRDEAALPDVRDSSGHAAAADFDRDGDLDLVVAGRLVPGAFPDAPKSRFYRNDGGRFVDVTAEFAPALQTAGMVTSILCTDVDADGNVDLLVAAHWQPIRLLRNDGGKRLVDATAAARLAAHAGWWNSLCAWDCDGDGDLDYVAGNQGWNTKYKARPDRPAHLYFGDFDDNGTRDLVEAKYEGDNLLPVRGRSCSSQAMPFLKDKFKTYDAFAGSLLRDIYTEPKLAECGHLQATTLASCLLRNDGTGKFNVEELPRRAQVAPLFGMQALGDLLVAATNSYAPEPETGRHDGGTMLVLRATGTAIVVVPPERSGLCELGDHKSLVVRQTTRGSELLVARNDGPLHAHAFAAGRTVALPRRNGNPQAVGARLLVTDADGSTRACEVQAGSGYLSQSGPWLPATTTKVVLRSPDGTAIELPVK